MLFINCDDVSTFRVISKNYINDDENILKSSKKFINEYLFYTGTKFKNFNILTINLNGNKTCKIIAKIFVQ